MKCRPAYGALLACLVAEVPAAQAAGIDCGKARSLAEKAICASPGLLALDRQVATAYADALARQPQQQDAMRQDLIRWLKQRDAACALPTPDRAHCLTSQLTARLAALAPAAGARDAAAPIAAPPSEALHTAQPAARPADPAIPPDIAPQAAATLDQARLAAAEHAETMLRVTSAGRFAIGAKSASGAAIQLIDILAGPGDPAGIPGVQDGRLDALLDVGVYKLRVTSDPAASGGVALSVTPFRDAAPPAALPQPGFPLAAALRDGEQRAFWLTVPPDGSVRIEAAGRALGDLRLWRDGRELTALEPAATRVEPVSGHPLADLRLEGKVEPGTYLAVAYGGPPLPWTDNAPDQTFLLRSGASPALAEGWAGGPMGPFGSEIYDLPAAAGLVRLSLPASAMAELRVGDAVATLSRSSREPTVHLAVTPAHTPTVELRAASGQNFTLQALEQPAAHRIDRPGTYWVSAVVNGAGGDEVPAGVLLQRSEGAGKPPRIVGGTLPRIGPGAAWHARFNLRGPTTLLVQNTAGGALAVRSSGVSVGERGQPGVYDLPADYYGLILTPADGSQGSLDLTVGPPGAAVPPLQTLPPDPVLPFGVQTLGPGESLQVLGPSAPGLQFGLSARPVPVALAEGPLTVTQAVGSPLAIPVILAAGGTLAVSEVGGGPIGFGMQETAGASTVILPLADHARTVVLAWRRAVSPIPIAAPRPPGSAAALQPGRPASLDLMRGESRGFALTVPQGGLYRVETLGRLRTAGRIATAFIPRLREVEANGVGQNMLIQHDLRAGAYRVDVTALESAGHLGVSVTPAPMQAGAALSPGGSVRASLPAGSAIGFPLTIAEPNRRYRLDVPSHGDPWQGRIEDAQGWPMTTSGPLDGTMPELRPGDYRLVVAPASADRQVVARLAEVAAAPEIVGHGPHALPFEAPQTAVWREPDGPDQPRTPDSWTFELAGSADVVLNLGDGMLAALHRAGEAEPLARTAGHYAGTLEAGQYRLDATSLGRNDRLAYTVALTSQALQPGVPRIVALPSSTGFAIAEARVVSLTSFGNTPVKAVLRRDDGSVVARIGARSDDWNIAASRLLPAGRYRLDLAAASQPGLSGVSRTPSAAAADQDAGDKASDDVDAETPASQSSQVPDTDQSGASGSADDAPAAAARTTELRLALPEALPAVAAPARATELTGAGVHVLTVDSAAPGKLLVAQAASEASLVLALERRTAGGWQVVALDEGTAPIVASPADADPAAWRVEVWTVDAGAQSIHVAARALDVTSQPEGTVSLTALDGMPASVAVAHVTLEAPAPVLVEAASDLLAGGWAGQALASLNGPVLPGARDVWLLGRAPGAAKVTTLPLTGVQAMIVLPGQVAQLAAAVPAAGHVAVWRAEGGFAQPGLGAAAGIASFSAVAPADRPVVLRNASGDGPLRLTLARLDPELLPARTLDAPLRTVLPPRTALPLRLAGGDKVLQADLGAGVAAFVDGSAVWAGAAPVSRSLPGGWMEMLLVNTGDTAAPASLAWQPAPPVAPLRSGTVLKRFFGAAGSFELPFDATAGTRLASAGDASLTAIAADGTVRRGQEIPLSGAGRLVVEHGIGPIAVWLAAEGVSPWPEAAVQPVKMPARLALSGPAMTVGLKQTAPGVLHVSTTAPVLAALVQAGRTDPPRLFQAGAELHVMIAAGAAELRLYSPADGPLSGSLMLSAEPVTPVGEGLGAPVTVAPGESAVFAFSLAKAATIGVGVRADPDRASVRLLDASGAVLGEGVAQLRALRAGQYLIEARVPPESPPTIIRPAVIGVTPRGSGPPPDVARQYLELVGLKPAQGTTP